jgi:hypothetical protein
MGGITMSELTAFSLIQNIDEAKLEELMQIEKIIGYYQKSNSDWTILAVSNPDKNQEKISKKLSDLFEAYVISLIIYEDFNWGYTLYQSGKKIGKLDIIYDDIKSSTVKNAKFLVIRDHCSHPSWIDSLEKKTIQMRFDRASAFQSENDFLESFNILYLKGTNFESIEGSEAEIYRVFKEIGYKGKQSQAFDDMVLNIIYDQISRFGYEVERKSKESVRISKNVNGLRYGVSINHDAHLKEVAYSVHGPNITIQEHIALRETICFQEFTYKTKKELKEKLQNTLMEYIVEADRYLNKRIVPPFDIDNEYVDYADPFLKKLGFLRSSPINNIINGGEIAYSNDRFQIVFMHSKNHFDIHVQIRAEGEVFNFQGFVYKNLKLFNLNNKMDFYFYFENKQTFKEQLLRYLWCIKTFLDNQDVLLKTSR